MDVKAVFAAHLLAHLPDGLQKGLGLDISHGAADLRDDHVRLGLFLDPVDKLLDLVGDMGNHLHRMAQIFPLPFLFDDVLVYLSGGQIGETVQILVDKTLIMSEIQVRFRPVLRHEYFSMLQWAHGSRVHVDIGIQLLSRHLEVPGPKEPAQRRCGNALSQAGDHASRYENKFCHLSVPPFLTRRFFHSSTTPWRRGRPHRSPPSPGSASRNPVSFPPVPDKTPRKSPCIKGIPS